MSPKTGTDEAGGKGVRLQLITELQTIRKSQPGGDRGKPFQPVVLLDLSHRGFSQPNCKLLTTFKSSCSEGEAITVPSGSSEHVSQSDPAILVIAVSPQAKWPKAALQRGILPRVPQ